jgi:hypothetical protein
MDKVWEEIGWIVCVVLGFAMFFGGALMQLHTEDQKRQDKRYEKCIDKGWQWVDNGCIKP